ncbi:MAG: GTP-binding protein [Nocardioidaceae bacterium]
MPEISFPRSFRPGVAGPVGTGHSSLIATVCRSLSERLRLGVVTDDFYTDKPRRPTPRSTSSGSVDARFLRSEGVLAADRIRAVETGACPRTAIRDAVLAAGHGVPAVMS